MIHPLRSAVSLWLRSRSAVFFTAIFGLAFGPAALRAGTQSLTIYGTNVSPGTIDPNTDCSKDGDVTWLPAYALTPEHPWQEQYPIAGTTRWISRSADGQSAPTSSGSNPEILDFRIRFYAPSDLTSPSISFILDPDNYGDIYLNGTKLNSTQIVGPSTQQFTINNANIVPGLNTILVRLTDTGGWLGINYSVTVSGNSASNTAFQRLVAPPAVTNITSTTASGDFKAGTVIPIQMTFTDAVNVTGAPKLTLATGTGDAATYVSGSGTSTLTFNYTVQAGDTSSHLDFASTSALALNGGSIISSAADAQAANLTLPSPGASGSLSANTSLIIDTTAPVLNVPANITTSTASASGATVSFAATATDAVTSSPTITYSQNSGTNFPVGTTTVHVTATDGAGNASTGTFTVTVNLTPTFASTGTTLLAEKGVAFTQAMTATGTPAPTFTVSGLPTGLSINAATGVISGTPSIQGTYPVTVTATNAGGSANQAFTLTVGVPFTAVSSGVNKGTGVAVDASGNLYIANYGLNNVIKVAPSGAQTTLASYPTVWGPTGLALDAAGNLYVASSNAGTVVKLTSAGVSSVYCSAGITSPWALAFDASGALYASNISNGYVSKIPVGGGTATTFAANFNQPTGLAFDSAGNLYVGNNNLGTISKVTPTGATSTFASGLGTGIGMLAMDSFGDLFLVNGAGAPNSITKVSPTGTVTSFSLPSVTSPGCLAFDTSGTLYFTDFNGTTVTHLAVEPAPLITSSTTASGTYGTAFSYTITASNAPTSFSVSGLASGLTLNSATGAITGTPTTAGSFSVQLTATNLGTTGPTTTLNLTIAQAVPVITWTAPAAILQGTALSSTQLDATASVPGSFVYSPAAGTVLATGANQTLRTTFTPTDSIDYATVSRGTTITVDAQTTIASVSGPASGDYGIGKSLSFTVNYTAGVTVSTSGGTPTIAVTIGGVTRQATYVSGSGTTALVFKYTIQSGDTALNGITVASNVSLNGGTIKDGNGFAATTSFTAPNVSGLDIESVAPTLTWVDSSKLAFNANFQSYASPNFSGGQYQTGKNAWFSGSIPGWTANGLHAVHAVDLTGHNDYAIQIWQDNVLDSPSFGSGNAAGTDYEVAFEAGPTVQVDSSQPTTAADGITVSVLRANNSVLATYTYLPGAWQGEDLLVPVNFHYTGDGSGALHLEIRPSNFNSGHFGGAIDDLIVAPAAAFNASTIEVTATSAAGAAANFLTSAYSEIGGDIAVTAAPVSGSTFALGSSTVTLSAQDAAGNAVSQSFTVKVDPAQATITFTTPTNYVYDGTPKAATYTTSPAGLTVGLVYDGSSSTAPSSAGSHPVVATIDPSQTWVTGQPAAGSVAIAKATPAISVTPYSVTYDSSSHSATGAVKGVQGESLAGLDLSGTAHTNAGSFTDPWTFTDVTGNYANASGSASDLIAQATATVTVTAYAGTYDGAAHTASGTATGVGGANLNSLLSVSGAYTNVPGGTVSWSFTDPAGNYQPASGTSAVAIAKAGATVSVIPYAVTYDGASHVASGSAKGVLGETLSGLNLSSTAHTSAGTYGDTWTFTDGTGNYSNATGSVSDKITAATATFSVTPVTFVYNGSSQGPTIVASPAGATFTVSGVGSATNAGSYSLTANATGNYAGTSGATAWKIVPGTVNLNWAQPAGITYGTPLGAAQLNATANVPGSFTYSPDLGAILSVGAGRTLRATFTPADQVNYGSQTVTATIDVAANPSVPVVTVPANQTLTATGPSGVTATYSATAADSLGLPIENDGFESPATGSYIYEGGSVAGNWQFQGLAGMIHSGNAAWGGTASYEGSQYAFLQSAASGQGSVTSTASLSVVAGQSYTIWWAQASRTNIGGSLTYAVTIHTPSGDQQIYSRSTQNAEGWQYYAASFTAPSTGDATVKFSILSPPRVDDTIFLDAVSVTTTGPVPASTAPASGSTFAPNTTTTVSASATNIAGTEGSGSFTVAVIPQQVTISFTTPAYTYDGTGKAASATTSPAGLPVTFSYNGGPDLPVNAGTYPVTATVDAGWAAGTASGSLSIGQATATISVTPYAVTFNGAAHTAAGTATGVGGADLSSGLSLTGTTHTNAGSTTDPWTFTDPNGNYAPATGTVADSISQAAAVVTVTPYSVTYSGTAHLAAGSVTGVLNEPLAGLNLSGTSHTNVGNYSDSWSFTDATGNYLPASGNASDVIGKANASISVAPYTLTYDGNPHTATGAATGVRSEPLSGLTVTGTTHTNAGTYADSWSFTDGSGNYNAASGNVSDSIAKANPTVTVTPYNVTYDGNAHTATGAATGVNNETLAGLSLSGTAHTDAGSFNDAWTFTDGTGNYNDAGGSVSDQIAAAPATFTVTPLSFVYNGSAQGPVITASPAGATFAVSGTGSATNAGSYSLTATASGNYAGTSGATAWQIAPGTVTLTWPAPSGIVFGTPLGAAQLNATANIPGAFTYSPDAGAVLKVGSGAALKATFTPADAANYGPAQTVTTTIDVAANPAVPIVTVPADQSVTATGSTGAAATFAASATDALGLTVFADGFESKQIATGSYQSITGGPGNPPATFGNWVFSSTAGVINGPSAAWGGLAPEEGNQYIWLQSEGFDGIGQGSIQSVSTIPVVAGQSYTVWWNQASRSNNGGALTYAVTINGPAGPVQVFSRSTQTAEAWQLYAASFTATTTGSATLEFNLTSAPQIDDSIFLDDITVTTTGSIPVTTTPASGSTFAVGPTTVTASATNFAGAVGTQSFAVNVSPLAATIQLATTAYTYDGTAKVAVATTTPPGLPVIFSYNGSANPPIGAGTYAVTAAVNSGWATGSNNGSLTISQAAATVSVTPYNVTYDGNSHIATGSAQGVQGENLIADLDLSGTTQTNAGSAGGTWAFHDPNGNYADASGPVADVIAKATASFAVSAYSVTYDGNAHTATGLATGVGTEVLPAIDFSHTVRTNAGNYTDPWTFAGSNNYNAGSGTVSDVIAQANATVSVTPYSVTYDGNTHTATGSAIGVHGDVLTTGLALGGTTHTGAGTSTDTWTFHDLPGNYKDASGVVTDTIAKANANLSVTPYNVTYDGQSHTANATATGVKGENLASEFGLTRTTHLNAGTYHGDAWTFTDTTGNYNSTSGAVDDSIAAATAKVTVTGFQVTYDGSSHTASAAVTGINNIALAVGDVDVSKTTRTNAGTTVDPWTFSDASGNYAAASGTVTDVINKANATVAVTAYSVTYDGKPHAATGTATGVGGTGLSGLSLTGTSHTAAASYSDTWTFTDTTGNYNNSSAVISDLISKAKATIVVTPYSVAYDGNAHTATGSATGVGGVVLQGLDLSGTTHTLPNTYADTWTFTDVTGNYQSVTATALTDAIGVTALVRQGITLSGNIDGSVQVLTGSADILNGNTMISGDLIVPGTPTVTQNGHITYAGTVDETGSASPSNYQIILNGNVVLRHVIRRVNPIAMPTVPTPPTPTGTQSVTINKSGQAAPNWTTAKDVTLNGNVGSVTMPAGTYGTVVVNGNSTLVLGVAGATSPSVYNLQGLTVNGNGALQIVGPVVINSLNTVTANGNVGIQAHPEWLTVNVSAGGVTLNGNVTMYGTVVAPTASKGQVVINGNSDLYGSVTADSLVINGNGLLDETP